MMNENSFIYRFLCTSWVLITVVSRNNTRRVAVQVVRTYCKMYDS